MATQTVTGRTPRPVRAPQQRARGSRTGGGWRLSPGWRKGVLTAHVVLSVGWIGLAVSLIALAAAGLGSGETWPYRAVGLLGGTFLLPLSLSAFLTGVLLSLGTKWGLVRYYWVAAKLFATIALVVAGQLALGRFIATAAERAAGDQVGEVGQRVLDGSIANLVLLVVLTVLSVYKPWGRTRRGKAILKGAA